MKQLPIGQDPTGKLPVVEEEEVEDAHGSGGSDAHGSGGSLDAGLGGEISPIGVALSSGDIRFPRGLSIDNADDINLDTDQDV